jgi:hypothetical protein
MRNQVILEPMSSRFWVLLRLLQREGDILPPLTDNILADLRHALMTKPLELSCYWSRYVDVTHPCTVGQARHP